MDSNETEKISMYLKPEDKEYVKLITMRLVQETGKPVNRTDAIRDALRFRVQHLDSECPGRES